MTNPTFAPSSDSGETELLQGVTVNALDLSDSDDHSSFNNGETEVSRTDKYLTPPNIMPYYFEFPPTLRHRENDNNECYFDLSSVGWDLYIPHPLSSCEGTEETESTVLIPSFVKLRSEAIDTEQLSMPSFESDSSVKDSKDNIETKEEGKRLEENSQSRSTTEEARQVSDDLPEKQVEEKDPACSTQTHPLNVSKSRRKSLGAYAA